MTFTSHTAIPFSLASASIICLFLWHRFNAVRSDLNQRRGEATNRWSNFQLRETREESDDLGGEHSKTYIMAVTGVSPKIVARHTHAYLLFVAVQLANVAEGFFFYSITSVPHRIQHDSELILWTGKEFLIRDEARNQLGIQPALTSPPKSKHDLATYEAYKVVELTAGEVQRLCDSSAAVAFLHDHPGSDPELEAGCVVAMTSSGITSKWEPIPADLLVGVPFGFKSPKPCQGEHDEWPAPPMPKIAESILDCFDWSGLFGCDADPKRLIRHGASIGWTERLSSIRVFDDERVSKKVQEYGRNLISVISNSLGFASTNAVAAGKSGFWSRDPKLEARVIQDIRTKFGEAKSGTIHPGQHGLQVVAHTFTPSSTALAGAAGRSPFGTSLVLVSTHEEYNDQCGDFFVLTHGSADFVLVAAPNNHALVVTPSFLSTSSSGSADDPTNSNTKTSDVQELFTIMSTMYENYCNNGY